MAAAHARTHAYQPPPPPHPPIGCMVGSPPTVHARYCQPRGHAPMGTPRNPSAPPNTRTGAPRHAYHRAVTEGRPYRLQRIGEARLRRAAELPPDKRRPPIASAAARGMSYLRPASFTRHWRIRVGVDALRLV